MDKQPQVQEVKIKAQWQRPRCRSVDAKSAELGLGVGADLIILGTSS